MGTAWFGASKFRYQLLKRGNNESLVLKRKIPRPLWRLVLFLKYASIREICLVHVIPWQTRAFTLRWICIPAWLQMHLTSKLVSTSGTTARICMFMDISKLVWIPTRIRVVYVCKQICLNYKLVKHHFYNNLVQNSQYDWSRTVVITVLTRNELSTIFLYTFFYCNYSTFGSDINSSVWSSMSTVLRLSRLRIWPSFLWNR